MIAFGRRTPGTAWTARMGPGHDAAQPEAHWDLMISRLASMAVLLQRLGRLARFQMPPHLAGVGGP
ncbi:hypothetical protein OG896_38465 [Streptomyces sp. NBC_00669]|uniref:hypothetical protein n=1 Tax=Streptomyces sp. NBC_00669 TaxID=2976011 RepID=UPI002E313586|nr:hypothetical protein [Streptomyces sp. NBC_00669]